MKSLAIGLVILGFLIGWFASAYLLNSVLVLLPLFVPIALGVAWMIGDSIRDIWRLR